MASSVPAQGPNPAAKLVDIETQMSFIQLSNGKFLVVDTVEMNDRLRDISVV